MKVLGANGKLLTMSRLESLRHILAVFLCLPKVGVCSQAPGLFVRRPL